jgi:DNA mismatch repair protein MSH6
LKELYPPKENDENAVADLPEAIHNLVDNERAIIALGAMIWYLRQLNIDKALLSARNFNIYDPLRKGQGLLLDGQTLAHIEVRALIVLDIWSCGPENCSQVLLNSDGTEEGTLHHLLGRCITPFGEQL